MKLCGFLLSSVLLFSCASGASKARLCEDFTQDWRFFSGDDPLASESSHDDSGWRALDLPHDWSIEADFSADNPATPGGGALPGGIGWYRKTFHAEASTKDKNVYIDFDGIYWNSKVWINGHLLGERPNGYISFRYDLTPYLKAGEKNVVAVRVDNSQQPNSRWYTGSGIYRHVWLVTVNPVHVDHWGTCVTTPEVSEEKAGISLKTKVRNTSPDRQPVVLRTIVYDPEGNEVAQTHSAIEIAAGETTETEHKLTVNAPNLWSIEKPSLYKTLTRVEQGNTILDEYETPLGIRYFSFDARKGFFLNGKPVKIKGVCHHHDQGCLGTAVNIRALERQLEILKEMGCNGIRMSHNPPAPELLDLCDRMGFIVMNEAFDMWQKKKSPYDYSRYFAEWHERDLTDLILRDRNHPSIFMWSIGNEVLEQWSNIDADTLDLQQANLILNFAHTINKAGKNEKELHYNSLLAQRLAEIVRKSDPTRPVTSGNNETKPGNHLFRSGAMDIIGFNYHEGDWITFPDKFPGQPFIVAESTSGLMSRGVYTQPSDSFLIWPDRWDKPLTKEVQQCSSYDHCHVPWGSTHERSWQLVKNRDYISGMYLWTGFDYLGEPTPFWWPSRSSYFGAIDLAGFPKDIYYMYQSEWTDKPVLHLFPHWNWQEGETVDVWAYYNQADEVELFLNGESLGRKSKEQDTFHVSWRVAYQKGTLKAVSYRNGQEMLSKEIITTGKPVSIRLTADRKTIQADGRDLAFITVEALDAAGNAVPIADDLISFSIEGDGAIAGTDNGDPTDPVSLKKPFRKLFNGKALVVVQAGKKAGNIKVHAKSETLKEGGITIQAFGMKNR